MISWLGRMTIRSKRRAVQVRKIINPNEMIIDTPGDYDRLALDDVYTGEGIKQVTVACKPPAMVRPGPEKLTLSEEDTALVIVALLELVGSLSGLSQERPLPELLDAAGHTVATSLNEDVCMKAYAVMERMATQERERLAKEGGTDEPGESSGHDHV